MPTSTFCYELPDGRIVRREARIGHEPRTIRVGGKVGLRDFQAEARLSGRRSGDKQCRTSVDLGVHPKQIPAIQNLLERRGVTATQFDKGTGDCYIQNRKHRNDILKARGMRDQDAGYGDWAGDGKGGGARRD